METVECKGSVYRIRNCAYDLLLLEEDLLDGEDQELWELVGRELRLKSAFLYCDLNQVISSADDEEHKQFLTDLGNRLFYHLEELGHAVKNRSVSVAQVHYSDTALALHEVMDALSNHP